MGINDTYFNPFNPGMDYTPPKPNGGGSFNAFNPGMDYVPQTTGSSFNTIGEVAQSAQKPVQMVSGGVAPEVGDVLHLSNRVENTLNQRYPNGWRIVGIGRSPSIIMETMRAKGLDAKSCPISGLTNGEWDFAKQFSWLKQLDTNDVKTYGEYLKEIGISGEDIARDSKTTVFVDYTKTGNSLRNFADLIGRSEIGIKKNAEFLSINTHLIPDASVAEREMIDRLWERQGMKIYSFMPRMSVEEMGNVKQIMANFKPAECALKFLNTVKNALRIVL